MRFFNKLTITVVLFVILFAASPLFLVAEAAAKVSSGSMLGGVLLEGLTFDEAEQKLMKEVELWQSEAELIATFDNGTFLIPREIFQFDIQSSIEQLKQQTKQPWYLFFLKDKSAQLPLIVKVSDDHIDSIASPNYIDVKATLKQATMIASYLGKAEVKAIYKEDGVIVEEEIASVDVSIPETYVALGRLVAQLNGQKLNPNSQYSFLKSVVAPIETSQSGKEMNFVGSAFYALLLESNVEILERHSQGEIPHYLEPGIEVKISQFEDKDLVVFNPNPYSLTVYAEVIGNTLTMSLHSVPTDTVYEYQVENKVEIPQRTIYRFSKDLRPRQLKTIDLGKKGIRVDIYRVSYSDKGKMLNKELISKDFYPPSPKVILVSAVEPPIDDLIPSPDHPNDYMNEDDSDYDDIKGYEIVDLEEEEMD